MASNMTITVDSKGLKRAFDKAPYVVARRLNQWVSRTKMRAERAAKQYAKDRVDTGQTQSSIRSTIGPFSAEVKPNTSHAIYAHEGRKPGRMPPFRQGTTLHRWATKRGIPPFVLAKSIARKGIRPHRFMDMAHKEVKPVAERDARDTLNGIVRDI